MKVIRASKAGFCFGVKRAVKLSEEASKKKGSVHTLGPVVHNPQAIERLEQMGVKEINEIKEARKGIVIIRAHGIPPEDYKELESKGIEIVDATCPFVKKAQDYARMLHDEGYTIVIIGEKEHPEVRGIKGHAKEATVIETPEEAERLQMCGKMGVVVQTTQEQAVVGKIIPILFNKTKELRVFNTICSATGERQEAVKGFAKKVDVIVVVGGRNSGNTRRLAQIAERIAPTYHIETARELKKEWFKGAKTVGVAAGASTPDFVIDEVVKKLESY
ncbi:4-hydroxy-3-methylbut-2-enyl diphosphate reductase [Candidatus Norongarragalina meridionalis]|nr:4-hydroxy-3-methylbut-2-enyl diphosphate reductase [Candidatus Norongarragalina meridionalis]